MTLLKTKLTQVLALVVTAGLLAGCGSKDAELVSIDAALQNAAKSSVQKRRAARNATPVKRTTRADIAAIKVPLMYGTLEKFNADTPFAQADIKPPVITWRSPDDASLTFADSRLIQTRGFLGDLMASSQTGPLREGTYSLERRTLDGEGVQVASKYNCNTTKDGTETIVVLEVSHKTTRYTENCTGASGSFANTYWKGGNTIWRGRHFISDSMGYIVVDRWVK